MEELCWKMVSWDPSILAATGPRVTEMVGTVESWQRGGMTLKHSIKPESLFRSPSFLEVEAPIRTMRPTTGLLLQALQQPYDLIDTRNPGTKGRRFRLFRIYGRVTNKLKKMLLFLEKDTEKIFVTNEAWIGGCRRHDWTK